MLKNGHDPSPSGLLLIKPHKEIESSGDDLAQQAFVSLDTLSAERLLEIEVERYRNETSLLGPVAARGLGQQMQLNRIVGLKTNHKAVMVGAPGRLKNGMRDRPEVDDNLGTPCGQTLACT